MKSARDALASKLSIHNLLFYDEYAKQLRALHADYILEGLEREGFSVVSSKRYRELEQVIADLRQRGFALRLEHDEQ